MSYVEDDLVLRCIEHVMQAYHELYSSETRSEMAGIHRTAFDHILTDLLTEYLQILYTEALDICRGVYVVKKCICRIAHQALVFEFAKVLKNAIFAKISPLALLCRNGMSTAVSREFIKQSIL
jgi:hypothetical protein